MALPRPTLLSLSLPAREFPASHPEAPMCLPHDGRQETPILRLQCAYLMQILAAESLLNMALEWHRLTMVGRRWKPQM
jgi:hypothetical protein